MRVGNGGAAGHVEHRQRPRLYRRRRLGLDLRGGGTTETPSAWAGRCASVRGGLTGCPRSRETVTAAARRVARDRRYRPARLPRRMEGTTGATRAVRPTPSACRSSPLARAGARRQPRRRRGRGLGPFDGYPPTPALPPVLAARPSRPRGAPGSAPPHGRRRWPPCHGSRTVRSQPVREAWSTGAEVAGAPLGRRAVHHRVLISPSQDLPALQR